ncbi:hypothetical protein JQ628_26260 [Bradyrhizobium lablabi]|nr:hypothetical protein [Bradyrhizobium lablabi]
MSRSAILTLCLVAIAVVAWIVLRRSQSRIWFKTFDEVAVVRELLLWAAPKVPGRRGRMLFATPLAIAPYAIPHLYSISRGDLAVLAPYIDEWIEGKLPPQNLPAEYEDIRPKVLLAFKQRLRAEGRWPSPGA